MWFDTPQKTITIIYPMFKQNLKLFGLVLVILLTLSGFFVLSQNLVYAIKP
jgi:hypothetical protein